MNMTKTQFTLFHRILATLAMTVIFVACPTKTSPGIGSFTATPDSITNPGKVKLAWSVDGATSISIDNGVGDVTGTTSKEITVNATTTFTMTASNANGVSSKQVIVTITGTTTPLVVPGPTINSFTVTPDTLSKAGLVTFSWDVSDADSVTITDLGNVNRDKGSVGTTVSATKTFVLTATNAVGTNTKTLDVTVGTPATSSVGVWDTSKWNEAIWQ
jgi:hypothetical protein